MLQNLRRDTEAAASFWMNLPIFLSVRPSLRQIQPFLPAKSKQDSLEKNTGSLGRPRSQAFSRQKTGRLLPSGRDRILSSLRQREGAHRFAWRTTMKWLVPKRLVSERLDQKSCGGSVSPQ